jgi:hypothetical protein
MIESICQALEVKPYQLFLEENDYIKKISPERTDNLIKSLQTIIEKTIRESDI